MNSHMLLIALSGLLCTSARAADLRYELLVAGRDSDNVVRFDLSTGADSALAEFSSGSKPSFLAASDAGRLFVGLRGNQKNVVELISRLDQRPDALLEPINVTLTIGRFGPGMMAFDRRGRLYVAADTERAVQCYDVTTRELVETITIERRANLIGLAVRDDSLYIAEYFQRCVVRVNLASDPHAAVPLISQSDRLDRPRGLVVGHNRHLLVSNADNDLIQEFEVDTGRFIRTFRDMQTLGASHVHDIYYHRPGNRYFVSSGNTVFELNTEGGLIARYNSPLLTDAQGVVCRPVRN